MSIDTLTITRQISYHTPTRDTNFKQPLVIAPTVVVPTDGPDHLLQHLVSDLFSVSDQSFTQTISLVVLQQAQARWLHELVFKYVHGYHAKLGHTARGTASCDELLDLFLSVQRLAEHPDDLKALFRDTEHIRSDEFDLDTIQEQLPKLNATLTSEGMLYQHLRDWHLIDPKAPADPDHNYPIGLSYGLSFQSWV